MSDGWQHIEINDHDSMVVLRPFTDEALAWSQRTSAIQSRAGIYTCEPRHAQDILRAAAQALLNWQ